MASHPERPYNNLPAIPPDPATFESTRVLKAVTEARVALARLDQASELMVNPSVLINTIPLLEAQASSEIENIVTTTDALFRGARADAGSTSPEVKETLRYRQALRVGFESVSTRPLTTRTAIEVCSTIKGVDMDLRDLPGTRIAIPSTGEVIYAPPEGQPVIQAKLRDWERFLHEADDLDPIVRMAVAHYQFEAIHPFSDGNGRTGRILNILQLHEAGLLRQPILYLSRYLIEHKSDYYRLLRNVTSEGNWEEWTLFLIEAVRASARSTTRRIHAIRDLQRDFGDRYESVSPGMRKARFLDVLFTQPYCRIRDVADTCEVSRQTATKWLDALVDAGALVKLAAGRNRLFLNTEFLDLLSRNSRR